MKYCNRLSRKCESEFSNCLKSLLFSVLFYLILSTLVLFSDAPAGAQTIYGAGTTFPAPLYLKWFQEYKEQTGITVNYQSVGSGGATKNITAHAVDFGATDIPLNDAEVHAAPGILHIPTVVYAVVIVYNLSGIKTGLHLTGGIAADVYLGKITRWNDPHIARLNPTLTLPDLAIFPIHQSNGSGNTYLLTNYLSAVSSAWQENVGAGKTVHWPVGLGGKQGMSIAQIFRQNEGSFGYIELSYAIRNGLTYAAIQNEKGNFVSPTLASIGSAAASAKMPPDFRRSIVNSPAATGYPITGFTYLLVFRNDTRLEVKNLLIWCLTLGQKDAATYLYAPLTPNIRRQALALVGTIK